MPSIGDSLKPVSRIAALAAMFIGCLVLLSWALQLDALKGLRPDLATMKANSALCFLLAGLALRLSSWQPANSRITAVARTCSVVVCLIALVTLAEYIFNFNAHIDQILFKDLLTANEAFPGRMSPATAVGFLLDGAGMIAITLPTRREKTVGQILLLIVFLIALLALVGYVYSATSLYRVTPYSSMAIHTVIGFLALSLGGLFLEGKTGFMAVISSEAIGGRVARRVLPVSIIFPIVVGWLRLKGVRAGLYDEEFGLGLGVLTFVTTFGVLIWWNALSANRAEKQLVASRERLRSLSIRLQLVREEERTAVAREIHDELGQLLTALQMDLFWMDGQLANIGPSQLSGAAQARSKEIMKLIDTAIESVQRIATELRPGLLDDLGLTAAMEWQAQDFQKRSGIKCWLDFKVDDSNLDPQVATALFRIMQEALTNVSRHSRASEVRITFLEEDGVLLLSVKDNGVGISVDNISDPRSLGLLGMRERVFLLDGRLDINGKPGEGTMVMARVPRTPTLHILTVEI